MSTSTSTTFAGLPSSLSARAVRYRDDGTLDPDDAAALLAVVHGTEREALGVPDTTAAELAEMAAAPGVRREETRLLLDAAGEPVGAVWYDVDEPGKEVFCETFVTAGGDALRGALVRHGVEVAHAVIAGRDGWRVRAGLLAEEEAYARVLREHGFAPVRRFWRMEIDSTSPHVPLTSPELPDGVTLTTGDDEAHKRAVYEVDQAAFADHWNFTPRTYEEVWRHLLAEPGARGEYWWLLRVAGDPAAICLLSDSRREQGRAYVSVLGVRREYRRRGLAQLLLQRAFVAAREEGLAGTALHVDSQSPTGATRLYESVGMRATQVIDAYELGR